MDELRNLEQKVHNLEGQFTELKHGTIQRMDEKIERIHERQNRQEAYIAEILKEIKDDKINNVKWFSAMKDKFKVECDQLKDDIKAIQISLIPKVTILFVFLTAMINAALQYFSK
jgi:glucosamine 6-phosphate synthetase-like amidotransferase/phosphosugar isomerase protein